MKIAIQTMLWVLICAIWYCIGYRRGFSSAFDKAIEIVQDAISATAAKRQLEESKKKDRQGAFKAMKDIEHT